MTEETTIAVSKGTKEEIEECKPIADTWDDLIGRIFHEWKDLRRNTKLASMDIVEDVEQLKSDVTTLKEQIGEHDQRDKLTHAYKKFQACTKEDVGREKFLDSISDIIDEQIGMIVTFAGFEFDASTLKGEGDD